MFKFHVKCSNRAFAPHYYSRSVYMIQQRMRTLRSIIAHAVTPTLRWRMGAEGMFGVLWALVAKSISDSD